MTKTATNTAGRNKSEK